MTPAERLSAFLYLAGRTPFAWGRFDCSLWLADWLVACGRPDPAAHLRGRYRTATGCARLLSRRGGLRAVIGDCAAQAGLAPTDGPQAGDVGVVDAITANGVRQVGGLCTGARWAVLAPRGLIVAPAQPLVAWRV